MLTAVASLLSVFLVFLLVEEETDLLHVKPRLQRMLVVHFDFFLRLLPLDSSAAPLNKRQMLTTLSQP